MVENLGLNSAKGKIDVEKLFRGLEFNVLYKEDICYDCPSIEFLKNPRIDSLPELCTAVMYQSTRTYADKKLKIIHSNSATGAWTHKFPLPVGYESFISEMGLGEEQLKFASLMPFRNQERVVFATSFTLNKADLAFFGLAEAQEDRYRIAGCKFTYAGDNPTSNEVKTAVDTLRRWWATFAGKEIVGITGPGRPKGTRVLSKEDIIRGYKNYIKQYGNPPSKEALGYYLRVDRSTIYAAFKAYNLPWPLEL
ncbi:MAG: hypothetical protein QME63_06555 [Actinomycetota bacterium]|nr:hypothetical protein [Actinomycetota bacterium]